MEHSRHVGSARRSDARLSRRSLVAAGALLATLGPAAASRAFARNPNEGNIPGCVPSKGRPKKCVCFLRGTRLQTPGGDIEIERLSIGDAVTLHDGEVRTIRWIGADGAKRFCQFASLRARWDMACRIGTCLSRKRISCFSTAFLYRPPMLSTASRSPSSHPRPIRFSTSTSSSIITPSSLRKVRRVRALEMRMRAGAHSTTPKNLARPDMEPYAAIASFNGGRGALRSRLRSALAPVVDIRQPQDVARDNIEALAFMPRAA